MDTPISSTRLLMIYLISGSLGSCSPLPSHVVYHPLQDLRTTSKYSSLVSSAFATDCHTDRMTRQSRITQVRAKTGRCTTAISSGSSQAHAPRNIQIRGGAGAGAGRSLRLFMSNSNSNINSNTNKPSPELPQENKQDNSISNYSILLI